MGAFAFKTRTAPAREILRSGVLQLQAAHVETASLDARILLEHVAGVSREQLLFALGDPLTPEQETNYYEMIEKRARRQPVAQITGKREFYGRTFKVTEATLDPRPDSETLIEAVIKKFPDRKAPLTMLDFGTGTGCLLLTLLKEFPKATGLGVDISDEALSVARKNARYLELLSRARFMRSNWAQNVEEKFDIVIANPPYIPTAAIASLAPEVATFEPRLALDGGEDGLDAYRAILSILPQVLAENGKAFFEIGYGQQQAMEELIVQNGLKLEGIKNDMQSIVRCIIITTNN